MTITAALLVGKMAMHTEKADETLLHNAHVAILNRQYCTEGQLHDSEYSHLNRLNAKKVILSLRCQGSWNHVDGLQLFCSSFLSNQQGTKEESTGNSKLEQRFKKLV